jgi:phosphate-selective porin OprO/OprP
MNINWWEEAQFRIGQFKMPFNLEELTSSNNIDFMERSYVNAHAPAKELGAMIHGVPTKGITYALAVSNGAGANNLDTDIKVNDKDIIGRVTVNAAELMGNSDMILHAGIAGSKGDIAAGAIGVAPRTLARGVTSLTLPVLSAATATVDPTIDRTRLGLEGAVAYGPVKVQGEWVRSSYEFNRTATLSHDVDFKSWYAEALWLITGEKYADFYKNGVFGGLKPKNDFVHPSAAASSGAWGLWELGLRFSKYDASDLNDAANAALVQNAAAAGLGTQARGYLEAKSYTVGIKFLPNANTRFMLNYVKTDFEEKLANTGALLVNNTAEDEEKAIIMRAQWMF